MSRKVKRDELITHSFVISIVGNFKIVLFSRYGLDSFPLVSAMA